MLILIAFIIVFYMVFIAFAICAYSKISKLAKADAAIILGASVKNGVPSSVFAERINHGLWLYQNGYVDKLIFTGGRKKRYDCSEARAAFVYALDKAVSPADILLDEDSLKTMQNLCNAALIAQAHNLKNFIIVSDPLHMKRAMRMARRFSFRALPSPTPSTKYRTVKSKAFFLMREVPVYIGYQVRWGVDRFLFHAK